LACCPIQIGDQRSRLAAAHASFRRTFRKGELMIGPSKRIWLLLFSVGVMLVFGYADAQPPSQTGAQSQAGAPSQQGAPNPYLMGSEG
jgi:hypothetical protein